MTSPRDLIANSPSDENTRDLMLAAYDRLQREYGMDEASGLKVADRLLALVGEGERSYAVLLAKVSPTASESVEQDTEQQDTAT